MSFVFMPETPHFHIMQGEKRKAIEALKFFRPGEDIREEINEIMQMVDESMKQEINLFNILKIQANRRGEYRWNFFESRLKYYEN